jgi:hypothetical protein
MINIFVMSIVYTIMNWEDQHWCTDNIPGWEDVSNFIDNERFEHSNHQQKWKITNDNESLFVYQKLNEKLDQIHDLTQEILQYDVDTNIKNKLNRLLSTIETTKQDTEYLNTRPADDVSDLSRAKNVDKLTDIEKIWKNKSGLL